MPDEPTPVEDQLAAARAVWPDLDVPPARFAGELARRLGVAELTPALLAATRPDEVYLAIACGDGAPAAVTEVERACVREIELAASKLRASPDQATELRGRLHELLFAASAERAAGLASYSGRGDLRGYLRVIATRELIRAVNRGRREVPLDADADAMLERLGIAADPEVELVRRRYGADVSAALRIAIADLDDRGRALLRYYLLQGWNIDRIGDLYGVHRATIARWLAAARTAIGDRIRSELAARLAISVDEVSSIVRVVQSKIEGSFERLLAAPAPAP